MRRHRVVCFLFALALVGAAQASVITLSALLSGAGEFPPNASPGTGTADVIYDSVAHTLQVDVSFSGLVAPVTASHIHCCVSPEAAVPTVGVSTTTPTFTGFPSGVTAGTYSHLFDLTLASSFNPSFITANGGTPAGAEATLANGLENGLAYLNIHTSTYPGGEIRGFLVTPEPGGVGLLGSGLALLFLLRRKRRA